jgi:psp operon transcriptional activator
MNIESTQEVLGHSEKFLELQEQLSRVAKVERPVLIIGERGTGKELAASRLHYLSNRWREPFLTLNCAALSPTLIESELFGHEAGAFTGAVGRRAGRFESASGGTLFLDEIGAVPLEVQEKILRVVEYGTFERVGGSQAIRVDVRIIGATNADLPALAEEGRFKRDLLDRLSFEVLCLPPLRARRGDIPLLANHFAVRMAHELGRDEVPEFSEEAMALLEECDWPGNVRELKNVVERAVYRASGPDIHDIQFNPFLSAFAEKVQRATPATASLTPETGLKAAVQDLERRMLEAALEKAKFNQRKAAQLLQLTYDQFRGYYRKHVGL